MGLSVLNQPAASAGGIKSVQRGSAAGSGNVTITAVDITKSFVTVYGTTSSGTVAASGTVGAINGNINAANMTATLSGVASVSVSSGNSSTRVYGANQSGGNSSNWISNADVASWGYNQTQNYSGNSTTFAGNSANLTGGSNNLVAADVQGYLSNSTTLVVSGACRYEVVEFN